MSEITDQLLDDDEAAIALGAMMLRVVAQLDFAGPAAVGSTGFTIGDVRYEVSVRTARP